MNQAFDHVLQSMEDAGLKEKAGREFKEVLLLTGYLVFFLCAPATYSMRLLGKFQISYFTYGAALIDALISAINCRR